MAITLQGLQSGQVSYTDLMDAVTQGLASQQGAFGTGLNNVDSSQQSNNSGTVNLGNGLSVIAQPDGTLTLQNPNGSYSALTSGQNGVTSVGTPYQHNQNFFQSAIEPLIPVAAAALGGAALGGLAGAGADVANAGSAAGGIAAGDTIPLSSLAAGGGGSALVDPTLAADATASTAGAGLTGGAAAGGGLNTAAGMSGLGLNTAAPSGIGLTAAGGSTGAGTLGSGLASNIAPLTASGTGVAGLSSLGMPTAGTSAAGTSAAGTTAAGTSGLPSLSSLSGLGSLASGGASLLNAATGSTGTSTGNALSGLAQVVGGALSASQASQYGQAIASAANPFGAYEQQFGQQLATAANNGTYGNTAQPLSGIGTQLANLVADPSSIYTSPMFTSQLNVGLNAEKAALASQGLSNSTTGQNNLLNYGMSQAQNAYNTDVSQLSSLYGQGQAANAQNFSQLSALSGLSSGSPAAAALGLSNIYGNVNSAANTIGSGLSTIANSGALSGLGSLVSSGLGSLTGTGTTSTTSNGGTIGSNLVSDITLPAVPGS